MKLVAIVYVVVMILCTWNVVTIYKGLHEIKLRSYDTWKTVVDGMTAWLPGGFKACVALDVVFNIILWPLGMVVTFIAWESNRHSSIKFCKSLIPEE